MPDVSLTATLSAGVPEERENPYPGRTPQASLSRGPRRGSCYSFGLNE